MTKSTGRILVVVAILLMTHAANATWKHFSRLKALGMSEESIRQVPVNLIIEVIFAMMVFTFGITMYSPPLKEITWASEMRKRTVEEMNSRQSFMRFDHLKSAGGVEPQTS
ncbi:hypothetical protein FRB93_000048 [Tulasnella sp. JGI-2019a]|nr:hypothetical protein FRB93_000048 [Tulasnella sp. JGI-2019a]